MKITGKRTGRGSITFLLLITLFTSIFLLACGNDDIVPEDPEEPKPELPADTTENKENGIVILDEEDIADYDKFFKPSDLKNINMLRGDAKWSFVRSRQSEHFIVFWEPGFGLNPNADSVPADLRVDIDDLLTKVETFYDMNVNILKFADTGVGKSRLDLYKMQIYLVYQTEWLATGAGYDDMIGALWVNPGTCKPVGSVIAHEIGHSFQYQVYADLLAYGGITNDFTRGFRYGFGGNGGNGFWEQTAQWQSYQSYPNEAFTSYNFGVYTDNYHRHIHHEWQRYASYFIHYYLADKYGIDYIARLWKEAIGPEDPMQAHMRLSALSIDEFNAEMYDAATHFVTWDFDAIRDYGKNFIGKHAFKLYQLNDDSYQVAYARCPGSTGYNVIPLNVPDAGTVIGTTFTGLQPGSALAVGDPGQYSDDGTTITTSTYNVSSQTRAGWRYGYVALLSSGERVYSEMNRNISAEVEFTIPAGCERLWFVVLGAPTSYKAHAWDEKESNDDQWPYKLKFTNTDLLGTVVIDPNQDPQDLALTYNISFAADAENYSGTTVNLNTNGDISKVAQALSMQPSSIVASLLGAKETPREGKIAFAALQSDGSPEYNTTANGHGFWFDSQGDVISWGSGNDSKVFAEFTPDNFEFSIGQYPGKCASGDNYTIKEALIYTKNGSQYRVTFEFNISID